MVKIDAFRFYGKNLLFLLFYLVPLLLISCSLPDGLILAEGGKANYFIVIPDEPTPVEIASAQELKEYLDQISGADFVILKESESEKASPQIIVGDVGRIRKLLPELTIRSLPYDGIVRETVGKNIILVGHPVRGTFYAVNTFLEEACGVRWWTSRESFIPSRRKLVVPQQHLQYAPALIYRESFYKDGVDNLFCARMKCNGDFSRTTEQYGGHHHYLPFVHSFNYFLPRESYFGTHPEWYSKVGEERVNHPYGQLCLTNRAMREEFIRNVMDSLRLHPEAGFVSISQNDSDADFRYCRCESCSAVAEEEGSQSGPILRFVNEVAEAIEKEFPDVWVETIAYQYSVPPPRHVKPRKNVIIRICTHGNYAIPLSEGEENRATREAIEGWSRIADNLYIWNYVTNFLSYLMPHPNLYSLDEDIRFFVKNKTIGLFEQGDYYCSAGDFVALRNYLISHLMWNPDLDAERIIDEFLTGYYGAPAAPYLRSYWDLLSRAAVDSKVHLTMVRSSTADWLDVPVYAQAEAAMRKALEVTKEKVYRDRIRREQIPLKFVLLSEYQRFKDYAQEHDGSPVALPDPEEALTEFMALLNEFQVTMVREDFSSNPHHLAGFEDDLRHRLFPEEDKK